MPADYGPLDEPARASAVARRKTMKLKGEDSHALSALRNVGECWYMNWTRKFDESPSKKKYGLVFVESKAGLLRVRIFQGESAKRLIKGTGWLRNFVRRTTRHDLLEVRGDSGTSWTVPGRGRDLNSAVVDEYVNSISLPPP